MRYKTFIFDVDATLLDYDVAERNAFINTMSECDIIYNDKLISIFNVICCEEWDLLKLGNTNETNIQKNYHELYYQYSVKRFERLLKHMNIDMTSIELSDLYLQKLSLERTLMPYAIETCRYLSNCVKLIIATNGLSKVQNSRLKELNIYFDNVFISEEIGYIKPSHEFFTYVLKAINANPKECLMIGDSLTSDIIGAKNMGMDTCWYNYKNRRNKTAEKPTYEITCLNDLLSLSQ